MTATIPTAPAQVGNGRTPHRVRTDGFHPKALCTRTVARQLSEQEAAKLGSPCKACERALATLSSNPPAADEAPVTDAPATEDTAAPAVHRFDSTGEAYDATQCRDGIHDGDVLVIESEGVVGFLRSAWPGAITTAYGKLHTFTKPARAIDHGKYVASVDLAEQLARQMGVDVDPVHASPDEANTIPADQAPFGEGDRVLCSDGLVRTATHVETKNGRGWVFMEDRGAWPVETSERIATSRVDEATADAHRAAAAIRAQIDAPDPVQVNRLGAALRYLRQANPARHAALIENADHITVQIPRSELAPGDIWNELGHPHQVLDVCLSRRDSDAPRWWAMILGATEEARACTGRKPWNTSLRLDLAGTSTETVQRPLPAAPATADTADTPAVENAVDPTSPEFAPFTSGTITETVPFYADVETRLAYPGHREDRITIHRAGHGDAFDCIALPHVPERSAATVLGAFGWEIADGLEYIAGMNVERGRVRQAEPTITPEGEELRAARLRHTVARAVALADDAGARHFRAVMPEDGGPYPIGWTYATTGYGENAAYGWVTAQGRGMNGVGVPTRDDADAIVRDWHATGKDAPTHTGMVDNLTDLPDAELGAVSVVLRGATERNDTPVHTTEAAHETVAHLFPNADNFEPVTTQDGLLGFTFQVGRLHGARYGWVTCYGTYGKSLERYRSHARDMLPAQVADARRAAGIDAPTPAPTYEPTPAPEGVTCIHGHTEQEGDLSSPAAVCDAKESTDTVGIFSEDECVDTRDCAVQAAQVARELGTASWGEHAYTWAVLCPIHEEQPAIGCDDCATTSCGAVDSDDLDACGRCYDCTNRADEAELGQDAGTDQPATFTAGDRVVCADGVARTIKGMAPAVTGEPARLVDEDGAEWIAVNCLPANPRDVSEALAASSVAASRVTKADTENPEWHEALAELGRLHEYLKAADPTVRAALVQGDAEAVARAVHADAHTFQPIQPKDAPAIVAWSFRTGHGASARYGVVTVECQVAPIGLYEYRTTAERAFLYSTTSASS
ncbi:hypothetical protein [Streptomyces bacillaris]|uniref:hypothetical protein n=1 Tax=Streptomyces bacillaris TaxID=68179 RepID=UPI00362F3531